MAVAREEANRVSVVMPASDHRRHLVQLLGELNYTVEPICVNFTAFEDAYATLSGALVLVITSLVEVEIVSQFDDFFTRIKCDIPLLVVNKSLESLIACKALSRVFGACVYPQQGPDLAAIITLTCQRHRHYCDLRQELEHTKEKANRRAHAAVILMDYHRLSTVKDGYQFLDRMAKSYQESLDECADHVIKSDARLRPRKKSRRK